MARKVYGLLFKKATHDLYWSLYNDYYQELDLGFLNSFERDREDDWNGYIQWLVKRLRQKLERH